MAVEITDNIKPDSGIVVINQGSKREKKLSYIGNAEILSCRLIGVSGSRDYSNKAGLMSEYVAGWAAEYGLAVVSGGARGVDMKAHEKAIESGGKSLIVLPCGINKFNKEKYVKNPSDWNRVLIVSEFNDDDEWSVGRAMARNNTIIELSKALVVVAAKESGGSINAGKKAIRSGNPVFVPVYEHADYGGGGLIKLSEIGARQLDFDELKHEVSK